MSKKCFLKESMIGRDLQGVSHSNSDSLRFSINMLEQQNPGYMYGCPNDLWSCLQTSTYSRLGVLASPFLIFCFEISVSAHYLHIFG